MNKFKDYNGGFGHLPNVHVYNDEGRFFIRSSKEIMIFLLFDNAIAISAVNSGAFTLAEGYLYTVEAFTDYYNRLSENGILYLSNPNSDYPRFITIAKEAFKRMGKEDQFRESIIVVNNRVSSYIRCKILIKKGSYTEKEVKDLYKFCDTVDPVPQITYTLFGKYDTFAAKLINSKKIELEYLTYEFDIRPSTVDWPFYSQVVKPENALKYKTTDFYHTDPFIMITKIVSYFFFGGLIFLIFLLLLFNLKGSRELNNKLSSIVYFASLGLGFMLLEIVLMQKYMLHSRTSDLCFFNSSGFFNDKFRNRKFYF